MAANFIPELLSAEIFEANRKLSVFKGLTNSDYVVAAGILSLGDRVKISQFSDVTVNSYSRNQTLTFEQLADASKEFVIDTASYIAVSFDECDLKQMITDPMAAVANNAAYKLADALDVYIASKYEDAGVTSGLGTTASPIAISSSNIQTYLNLIQQRLSEANCPREGRFIVVPPAISKLINDLVILNAAQAPNTEALMNGWMSRCLGFDVYESNNVQTVATTKYKILAGTRRAITLAEQINRMELVNPYDKFGKAIKGLHLYGAKVVRPSDLACLTCTV